MSEKHYVAVPTAYNIYRVSDDVLQSTSGLMATMPVAVVMETLVLRGLAKVVARIKPFDVEKIKDGGEDFYNTQEYESGVTDKEPEATDEDVLPGPWFKPDTDEEEDEDDDA